MIRERIKRLVYKEKASSADYIKFLRSKGAEIGEHVEIFEPRQTLIDSTRPWLVKIGNDVKITRGVTILTHGFDWSVLKGVYGEVLGSSGGVEIGNNVFIGMHSTILKGVHIGNNVIIGANSLVNKGIPDNVVAAGNPCKVIMTLHEYHEKRKAAQVTEAKELVHLYREKFGKEPDEKALHEFFWLFEDGTRMLPMAWDRMMRLGGNYKYSMAQLKRNIKCYEDIDDFLQNT